jgi:hypothetical protein
MFVRQSVDIFIVTNWSVIIDTESVISHFVKIMSSRDSLYWQEKIAGQDIGTGSQLRENVALGC